MLRSSGISNNAQLILAVATSSVSCDRELYLCNKLTPSTTEKDELLVTVQIISIDLNLEQKEQIQSFFLIESQGSNTKSQHLITSNVCESYAGILAPEELFVPILLAFSSSQMQQHDCFPNYIADAASQRLEKQD